MIVAIGRQCRHRHEDRWYSYVGRSPTCSGCQSVREQRRPPRSPEAAERKRTMDRERSRHERARHLQDFRRTQSHWQYPGEFTP